MDMKEKLVELIAKAKAMYADDYTDHTEDEYIAEMLLDNGVTVQEWISVKDRLPEKGDDVLLCRKWWNEIRNPQMGWYNDVSRSWFDLSNREIHNVTHWMPLPQPPKGE